MRGSLPRTVILALALGACTSATGDVVGGEPRPFDAAAPLPLVLPITEPTFADAAPTSWKGIYRDFFGRRATKSSCASTGSCHGAAGLEGTRISHFICADVDGCFKSLTTDKDPATSHGNRALVEMADIATPANAQLFKVIRFRTPDGMNVINFGMPQAPSDFFFSPADIDRMKAWIKAGAKND